MPQVTKPSRAPRLMLGLLLLAGGSSDQVPEPLSAQTQRLPKVFARDALAGPVRAPIQRVVDGDTLEVRATIWLGQSLRILVRIDGIDAPELRASCEQERRSAEAARDFLKLRLEGREILLTNVAYDKFGGRVRADVADAQGDIAQALLSAGLVRAYGGERREPWCP
jgi:micrococcal nuclease